MEPGEAPAVSVLNNSNLGPSPHLVPPIRRPVEMEPRSEVVPARPARDTESRMADYTSRSSRLSTTNRLEYLSNSINHELGLIELDPVTAVWNNDDLAVRGKTRHPSCSIIPAVVGSPADRTTSGMAPQLPLPATWAALSGRNSISLAKASKNFGCTQLAFSIGPKH